MIDLNVCRVLRDVIPPIPPGPEGSNGNGQLRAQWVARYIFLPHDAVRSCRAMAQRVARSIFIYDLFPSTIPRQVVLRQPQVGGRGVLCGESGERECDRAAFLRENGVRW
jgi:hypothetical protein